jgi:hypothetical protein
VHAWNASWNNKYSSPPIIQLVNLQLGAEPAAAATGVSTIRDRC